MARNPSPALAQMGAARAAAVAQQPAAAATDGVHEAFQYFDDLVETFSSAPKGNKNITTKWDGSPAVVFGTDPSNGKFFVGTKAAFSKNSKACYSVADVKKYYDGELASVLKDSLVYLYFWYVSGILKYHNRDSN